MSVLEMCSRLSKRKPKMLLALLAAIILLYFTFVAYLACCPPSNIDSLPLSPQSLNSNVHIIRDIDNQSDVILTPKRETLSCKERTNFVFIKGMKCATSTLLGVFYKFGYTRNLTFVSPLGRKMYLNWPYSMTMRDFRPSSRGYNILTDHSIYTESVMEAIMPSDTVYISIIREPLAHVKSIFQYFKLAKIAGIPEDVENPIVAYFSQVEKNEAAYTSHEAQARWCVPDGFSMTKNLMSHCHGMPLGFPPGTKDISNDTIAVDEYIKHLDEKFSLIMIVEYFYESLVLLRRLMCWTFKDIIFINVNVASYGFKTSPIPENIRKIHRKWDSIDYRLYDYFNRTFWEHVSRQGPQFYSEVEAFKLVESQAQTYCNSLYTRRKSKTPANMTKLIIEESEWNAKFTITSEECWMLGPNPYEMIFRVQKENDVREAKLLAEQEKIPDNRTAKSTC